MHQVNILHPDGLWDVTQPNLHVGCRLVFKRTGWVQPHLTAVEFLRLYDMPLGMDDALSEDKYVGDVLVQEISPLIVALVFRSTWAVGSRGGWVGGTRRQSVQVSPSPMEDNKATMLVLPSKSSPFKCRDSLSLRDGMSLDSADPSGPAVLATTIASQDQSPSNTIRNTALFKKLKKEHELAKAVKNNDAEVPIHLRDDAIWTRALSRLIKRGEGARNPPEFFKRAMAGFRILFIKLYHWRLRKEIYARLVKKYGQGWVEVGCKGGNRGASMEVEAAHEILWRTSENDWFGYPMGS
jgi:hypothetical protein